jgi:serine/threonine protein kinase SCH9
MHVESVKTRCYMANIDLARFRNAPTDDDGTGHISGTSTPQPSLQDKRFPSIMSSFQVGSNSITRLLSSSLQASGLARTSSQSSTAGTEKQLRATAETGESATQHLSSVPSSAQSPPLLSHEMADPAPTVLPLKYGFMAPYPTPPASIRSSNSAKATDSGLDDPASASTSPPPVGMLMNKSSLGPSYHQKSGSDLTHQAGRQMPLAAPPTSTVTESTVQASHFSDSRARAATTSNTPARSQSPERSEDNKNTQTSTSSAVHLLKKLTDAFALKSGTTTPTRALSVAKSSQSDQQGISSNGDVTDTGTNQSSTPPGAHVPAAKGKLTIKITEGKGLRRSRDPYVVIVFQRSELISAGPRPSEDDDEAAIASVAMGGVPIQRQASDSGRPMAIPMRSRQSSNTSIPDPSMFRNRNARLSFTNPKWDAEAVL